MVCLVMVPAVSFALADGKSNQLKVGYVVVTPSQPYAGGLAVFETFGETRGAETTQAAVMGSGVTKKAVLFVDTDDHKLRNIGVAITNPNPQSVEITLTLRNESGTDIATKILTLPAHNQTSTFVTQMFTGQAQVATKFSGTLAVTSSQPVALVGLRFRGLNFSTIPATNLDVLAAVPEFVTGVVGGTGAVILPQFAAGESWATEIVVANTNSQSAVTVRLDFFDQAGNPMPVDLNGQVLSTFKDVHIASNGIVILAHRNADGDTDF